MASDALFHGRRFYLTRAMGPQHRQSVRELIQERGGEVTDDLRGAIQLVGPEHLDPRQEWVSIDFVLDSVARGALQDLSNYMGQELAPASPTREQAQASPQSPAQAARARRQKRIKYSAEDDARMLVFLQSNFGGLNASMMSVPLSVWETAARKKVTNHSGQSMHERYRKQLRPKTPAERRAIISKGMKRTQAGGNDESEDEEEVEEIDEEYESGSHESRATPMPSTAATPAATTEQIQAPPAVAAAEEQTPTPPVARSVRDKSPPSRKSKRAPSPRHIDSSSEEEEEEEEEEEKEEEEESRGRKRLRPTTPEKEPDNANIVQAATASELTDEPSPKSRLRRQSSPMLAVGRPPLHREPTRRQTVGVTPRSSTRGAGITVPVPPPRSSSEEEEKEGEKEKGGEEEEEKGEDEQQEQEQVDAPIQAIESGDGRGVVFRSVWARAFADHANRKLLHDLFEPSAGSTTPHIADPPAESSPRSSPRAAPAQADEASPVPTPAAPASPSSTGVTPERQHGSPGSDATSTPHTTRKRSLSDAGDEQQALESPAGVEGASPRSEPSIELEVEHSTEQELNAQLVRINFETNASQQAILHALYYSSGSYATATAFLQGHSPVGMWSPQDDLLLASLTSEHTTTADVKAAARAGAFASMRVQRSAADIQARIRYLL